jgi:hypothetical protein
MLTSSHRKTLLLWNLNRGGQGPIWAVAPLDGYYIIHINKHLVRHISAVDDEQPATLKNSSKH